MNFKRVRRSAGHAPRRMAGMLSLVVVAGLLLAACDDGGDEDTDGTTDVTATVPAGDTVTPTEAATETPTETETATETPDDASPSPSPADAAGEDVTVAVETEGDLAPFLVDAEGMTLYVFTNDEDGVSNCTGDCLANWPPLTVPEGEEPAAGDGVPGELGVIEREDGEGRQVTYDGMPLYYFAADQAPGDTTGHEVGGVWFVVPPDGDAMSATSGSSLGY